MTVWRPIPWLHNHYEISSDGQMRSVARIGHDGRRLSGRLLKLGTRNGYKVAWPRLEGRTICVSIHRLVAEAFIPNPEGKPDVNHKDGDRANNSISNLEWVTKSENMAHAWRIGLCSSRNRARGERHYRAKATEEQVRLIRAGSRESFGLSKSALQHIRKGRTWAHVFTKSEDELERIERENNELLKSLTKRLERADALRAKLVEGSRR